MGMHPRARARARRFPCLAFATPRRLQRASDVGEPVDTDGLPIEGHDKKLFMSRSYNVAVQAIDPPLSSVAPPLLVGLPRVDAFDDILAGAVTGFAAIRLRRGSPRRRDRQEGDGDG